MAQVALPLAHDSDLHVNEHDHHAPSAGVSNTKLAMWVLIGVRFIYTPFA